MAPGENEAVCEEWPRAKTKQLKHVPSHPMRFERTRGDPTALAGRRLNHSATGARAKRQLSEFPSAGHHYGDSLSYGFEP